MKLVFIHGAGSSSLAFYYQLQHFRNSKALDLPGHSMGGAISMLYALRYPEEVRGIILMGTGAKLRVHPDYLNLGRDSVEDNSRWLENQMTYYPGVARDMLQSLKRRSIEIGPSVELNDLKACDQFDVMNEIQNINLPTLVICGDQDTMTPVKYANYLSEKIPGAQEVIVPGASHFVQLQKYKQVNASIEEFVASLRK